MITVNTTFDISLPRPEYSPPNWDKWEWQRIIWWKTERMVFNLQKRIYKATKAGRLKEARALTKLLLRSTYSIVLNIRKVTQDNSGKKTAGVDGVLAVTPQDRKKLATDLMELAKNGWHKYCSLPIRRIFIPKPNGSKRPLGIPTIKD